VKRDWLLAASNLATHIVLRHGMTERQLEERFTATGQDDARLAHTLLWLQNMHGLLTGYPTCQDAA
jgi:hypothetical protein